MKGSEKVLLAVIMIGIAGVAVALGIFLKVGSKDISLLERVPDAGRESKSTLTTGADLEDVAAEEQAREVIQPKQQETKDGTALAQNRKDAIIGRIVTESGAPLQGAKVTWKNDPLGNLLSAYKKGGYKKISPVGEIYCESREDGRFRLEEIPAYDAGRLLVFHPDYVPRDHKLEGYKGGDRDVADIIVHLGGAVSGYVRTQAGSGIQDVEVKARPISEKGTDEIALFPMSSADTGWVFTTGPDGYYRITGLPPGRADVYARHPEYIVEIIQNVALTQGREHTQVNFSLAKGHIIAGQVLDEEGQPLERANVRLEKNLHIELDDMSSVVPEFLQTSSAQTDREGLFVLKGLKKGHYTIRVQAQSYLPFKAEKVETGTQNLVVVMKKGGWVAGHVKDGSTGEGVEDFDIDVAQKMRFAPIPTFLKGKEAVAHLPKEEQDPKGAFYLEGLSEGIFALTITAEDYADEEVVDLFSIPGEGQIIEIILWKESAIEGRLITSAGEPVSGGMVYLKKPSLKNQLEPGTKKRSIRIEQDEDELNFFGGEKWLKKTESLEDGSFRLRGVQEGNYEVTASHEEHTDALPMAVSVGKGETLRDVELRLGLSGSIEGTVYDVQGAPKGGARIQAGEVGNPGFMMNTSVTDHEGKYSLKGLSPGEYSVSLSSNKGVQWFGGVMTMASMDDPKDAPGTYRVFVEEGKVTPLDLHEIPKGSVSGFVTELGAAVPDLRIKAFKSGQFRLMPHDTTQTDAEGEYSFEGLEAGDYNLVLDLAGLPHAPEEKVSVTPGGVVQRNFSLPSGRITGRITDLITGQPVPDARVSLKRYEEEKEKPGERKRVAMISISTVASSDGSGDSVETITVTGGGSPVVKTDEEGRYTIRYVKDGKYNLVASGGGYAQGEISPVKVSEGKETARQDLKLNRGFMVSGILVDSATGEPVPFCPVSFSKAGTEDSPTEGIVIASREDGTFKFEDLNPGDYQLRIFAEHYSGTKEFSIKNDHLTDLKFEVQPK